MTPPLTPDEARAAGLEPKYWRHETTGMMAAAVAAYLDNPATMSPYDIAVMRYYVRQWINAPVWTAPDWRGEAIEKLRSYVDLIDSGEALEVWLAGANLAGVDPL